MDIDTPESFVIVPTSSLSADAVDALVDEFILREGTDYGHAESTIEQKRQRVLKQIHAGHVKIAYSTLTEDCTLMKVSDLPKEAFD